MKIPLTTLIFLRLPLLSSLRVDVFPQNEELRFFFSIVENETEHTILGRLFTDRECTSIKGIERETISWMDSYKHLHLVMLEFLLRINGGKPVTMKGEKGQPVRLETEELEKKLFLFQIDVANKGDEKSRDEFFKKNNEIKIIKSQETLKGQKKAWRQRSIALRHTAKILEHKPYISGKVRKACELCLIFYVKMIEVYGKPATREEKEQMFGKTLPFVIVAYNTWITKAKKEETRNKEEAEKNVKPLENVLVQLLPTSSRKKSGFD